MNTMDHAIEIMLLSYIHDNNLGILTILHLQKSDENIKVFIKTKNKKKNDLYRYGQYVHSYKIKAWAICPYLKWTSSRYLKVVL